MNINEYASLAMRTNDGKCTDRVYNAVMERFTPKALEPGADLGELLNGALGLTGEAGEVSDMIKKYVFHGHALDRDAIIKELGDVAWYVTLLCSAIDISLEEVLTRNVEKLKARYPGGFSEKASIERVV